MKYYSKISIKPKFSNEVIEAETQHFFVKVYAWMVVALMVTGFVAAATAANPAFANAIIDNSFVFYGLFAAELLLVMYLVGAIKKISSNRAILGFIVYSVLNGFSLSVIFLVYTPKSIASSFFITAGIFAIMSIYGYFTKSDLTDLGTLFIMALFGIILASVVNFYFRSETFDWIITMAGIFIFVGLIAYDTQKIKELNIIGNEGTEADKKEAIIGALTLYLDFINLFLRILRLTGGRK